MQVPELSRAVGEPGIELAFARDLLPCGWDRWAGALKLPESGSGKGVGGWMVVFWCGGTLLAARY